MKWLEGFSKSEWRVLNVSLVLMMACAFVLSNDRVLAKLGGGSGRRHSVAEVAESQGDVRVKADTAKAWRKPEKKIYLNEVMWLGDDARVLLRLRPGVELRAGGKALFRMALIEGIPSVDMIAGEFDWLITGEQSVGIKGVRGILSGRQATVTIQVDPSLEEPKVRLTSGAGALELTRSYSGPDEAQAPVASQTANSIYFYVWRLEDFYKVAEQRVTARERAPVEVPMDIPLNWDHPVAAGPFSVQLAATEDFTRERRFFTSGEVTHTLDKALLGDNYWRVSFNNLSWSSIRMFRVEPRFLEAPVTPVKKEYRMRLRQVSQARVQWTVPDPMAGFVAELSGDTAFESGKTQHRWLSAPELIVEMDKPGVQYVRLRAFNSRQEISDWSPVVKVVAD